MNCMDPNSKASAVLNVLREGPATTGEIAAELGWTVHLAACHLGNLFNQGKIARDIFPTGNMRRKFLYRIAEGNRHA